MFIRIWIRAVSFILITSLLLAGCAPQAELPQGPEPVPQATAAVSRVTQEPAPYPLSEPGPYHAGKRSFAVEDAGRGNRRVSITVWYPAVQPEGSTRDPFQVGTDLAPDLSGAPYPLILSSTKMARQLAPYLISHGFAWASVDRIDSYYRMNKAMFEQPLDILFALNQVASNPPEGLEGMIDAEHAGAIGYSFDGYNSLALSGACIDPEYYLAQCPTPDATTEAILSGLSALPFSAIICRDAKTWPGTFRRISSPSTMTWPGAYIRTSDAHRLWGGS